MSGMSSRKTTPDKHDSGADNKMLSESDGSGFSRHELGVVDVQVLRLERMLDCMHVNNKKLSVASLTVVNT